MLSCFQRIIKRLFIITSIPIYYPGQKIPSNHSIFSIAVAGRGQPALLGGDHVIVAKPLTTSITILPNFY
jgi:hypothetical protein